MARAARPWFTNEKAGEVMNKQLFGLVVLSAALACGKPAEDPSSENNADSGTGSGENTDTPTPSTTATTPKPPATVEDNTPKVPYDKESVDISLNRATRQVKDNCGAVKDDQGKIVGPWGKTTVTVQLGHNGHSKGATLKSPFEGSGVGRCINNAFNNLIYPPFAGADTTLDWEVEVSHPDNVVKKP